MNKELQVAELDFWPHPLTAENRQVVVAIPGQNLAEIMQDKLPYGVSAYAIVNGVRYPIERWETIVVQETDIVQVRCVMQGGGGGGGSNPLRTILSIAVIVAAPFAAGALAPALGIGAGTIGFGVLQAGIAFAGLLIINSIFPPRFPELPSSGPSSREGTAQPPRQFSLSGGENRARPNEPLIMLLGQHRVFADLVAREYAEYDDNSDQYLNQIFDFGIGNLEISNPRIGDTLLSVFEDVTTQSQVNDITLVAGNVDSLNGGDFEPGGSPFIERTTATDTTKVGFDLTSLHFRAEDDGTLVGRETTFSIGWKRSGTSNWVSRTVRITSPDGSDARNAVRRSYYSPRLQPGVYDVRVRATTTYTPEELEERITFRASAPVIRAYQDDKADFTGRNAYALRIKATGQLYGRIQRFNADVGARIPDWDGSSWSTIRVTSNPASIMLWWLRGYRIATFLKAGYGLEDTQIDFPSLQAWHRFCEQQELECNIPLIDARNEDEVAALIGQCGWGKLDISTGKYGVIWENSDQPTTALVTPANIVEGSLSVSYDNENLSDQINGTYYDKDSDYLENTLGRDVPNFAVTGEFPITIPLEGITSGEQAAKEINRTAAAQFYHQRQITWEMLDEGRAIGIGDVVGLTNGLVGNGQGGRLLTIDSTRRILTVPFDIESDSGNLWIWLPDDTIHSSVYTKTDTSQLTLTTRMPAIPRIVDDHPSMYRIMLFGDVGTETKVRITGITPTGPHRYKFLARDEIPAYYTFRTANLNAPLIDFQPVLRPGPTGFTVTLTDFGSRYFSWNAPERAPLGYELRYGASRNWSSMRPMHEGLLPGSPYESEDRPGRGSFVFGLAAVYEEGLRSEIVYARGMLTDPGRVTQFKEVDIYLVQAVTDDPPDRPEAEGSFNFDTNTLTPPMGWLAGPEFPVYEANQVVYACTTTANTLEGNTWFADADDWIGPYVVGDADDLNIIYRRAENPPSKPADSETIPSGWYDRIALIPAGAGLIYISIGRRMRGSKIYVWQIPTQLEGQRGLQGIAGSDGEDGFSTEYIFTAKSNGAPITGDANLPDPTWNYDQTELSSDDGITRGSQIYFDGTPPDLDINKRFLIRFHRYVAGTPAANMDVGTIAWTQEAAIQVVGIDALQKEFIYTLYDANTLPANRHPDNAWTYDNPGTVNGQQWTDAAGNVSATN